MIEKSLPINLLHLNVGNYEIFVPLLLTLTRFKTLHQRLFSWPGTFRWEWSIMTFGQDFFKKKFLTVNENLYFHIFLFGNYFCFDFSIQYVYSNLFLCGEASFKGRYISLWFYFRILEFLLVSYLYVFIYGFLIILEDQFRLILETKFRVWKQKPLLL